MNDTTDQFLAVVFEGREEGEAVCLAKWSESGGMPGFAWVPGSNTHADYVNVATVTVTRGAGKTLRRRKTDVVALYCVYLDDVGTKYPEPDVLPSWVLETSAGNFQWGYLLETPLSGTEADVAVVTWREICKGRSDAVAGLTRLMRVPGARHSTGFEARLTQWAPSRVWTIEELADAFGVSVASPVRPPVESETVPRDDHVRDWLMENYGGERGEDGKVLITCPWTAEHTKPGGKAAYFPLGYHGRENRGYHCFHEHCAARSVGDLLGWAQQHGLAAPVAPRGDAHLTLMLSLPELDQMALPDLRVSRRGGPGPVQLPTPSNIRWAMSCLDIAAYTCYQEKRSYLVADWAATDTIAESVLVNKLQRIGIDAPNRVRAVIGDTGREDARHALLDSLPEWDGVDRFEELAATVTATDPWLWRVYLRRWLLQAVRAWLNTYWEPVPVGAVLVFHGAQGVGKTRWLQRLLPGSAVAEGTTLALNSKDSVMECLGRPIVELGELEATFRKADQEALKAFLTKTVDVYRAPYDRKAESWPRTTVFAGSVNTLDFLRDTTGSRRFLPITVTSIDYQHGVDMMQVWAQARALVDGGEQWWLTPAEDAARAADAGQYTTVDDIEERYEAERTHWQGHKPLYVNAGDVAQLLGYRELRNPRERSLLGALLRRDYGAEIRPLVAGSRLRGWMIPIPPGLGIGRDLDLQEKN